MYINVAEMVRAHFLEAKCTPEFCSSVHDLVHLLLPFRLEKQNDGMTTVPVCREELL